MRRRVAWTLLFVTVLSGAACAGPNPRIDAVAPTAEPGVLDVTALLDLSGSRNPSGNSQRDALQLWSDTQQARTGATARVRLNVVDVGSSDARLLLELRRAAEDKRVDAVIVGTPLGAFAGIFADAVAVAALPILLTLPVTEPFAGPGGNWTFGLAPTPDQLAARVLDAQVGPRPSVIVVPDGRPLTSEGMAIVSAYKERALIGPVIVRPLPERMPQAAAAISAAGRVHLDGAPREHAALAPLLRPLVREPQFYLSYLTEPSALIDYRDAVFDAIWPASRHLVPNGVGTDPTSMTRRRFVQAYSERHGPPSAHAAAAYDAISLLANAADRVGSESRGLLRDRIENATVVGVATTYSFSTARHSGFTAGDLALYRWNGTAAVIDTRVQR